MRIRFATWPRFRGYPNAAADYQELEDMGIGMITLSDSQSLHRELFVNTAVASLASRRATINAGPVNPLTRDPSVTASAIAAAYDLSGGRVCLSISSGDSALTGIGLKPASLGQVREYVLAVRGLWRDGESVFQNRTLRLLWPREPLNIPIYVVAEGPKSLRQAGEIADGVVIGMGLTPEAVAGALEYLRQGTEASGRSISDLDIWWQTRWIIEDDAERAKANARALVGTAANHAFRYTLEGKFLPAQFHEPVRRLMQDWDPSGHGGRGVGGPNERLVDDLGLTDYLTDRFAIVGTPSSFIRRIETLANLGVNQLRLGSSVGDRGKLLRTLADRVIPQFR